MSEAAVAQFPAVGRIAEQQLSEMDAVRDLSQTMLDRVSMGDWDEMLALQSKRDQALRACLKPPIEGEHAEATKVKIQQLLAQNQHQLSRLNKMPLSAMLKINGIGHTKAVKIKAALALAARLAHTAQ